MLAGLSAALGAGLLWGLVFLTPLLLADYPPFMLAIGRYLAFGVLALGLAWFDRAALARLTRADWIEAVKLALIGNLLYYSTLASAIQLAGGPVPTLIIGTLPVVIAITANLLDRRHGGDHDAQDEGQLDRQAERNAAHQRRSGLRLTPSNRSGEATVKRSSTSSSSRAFPSGSLSMPRRTSVMRWRSLSSMPER